MKTNPIVDSIWSQFGKKYVKTLRRHRSRFLPDDEQECYTLAKVARHSVDGPEIPVGTVVEVIRVTMPQESSNPIWRRMKKPYLSATVFIENERQERTCNLESLEPIA
jgi:hypothetical protein